ncbi:MAG: YibE/F family protein [Clostridium sp.]
MLKKFKESIKKNKIESILSLVMIILVVIVMLWNNNVSKNYENFNNENVTYVKGVVTETNNDELQKDPTDESRYLGLQRVKGKIKEGELEGQTVEIDNYLTSSSNTYVSKGTNIVISVDNPEGADPYCLVYNYDRSLGIYGIILCFFLIMFSIGGKKGLRACVGLVFTLFTIVYFMLPQIYLGHSPIIASIITVVITAAVSLVLLNGLSEKTLAAIISTALGVILVGIIFTIISFILNISGYNTDEADFMVLIAKTTNLKISEVLFAGVLISSLGAVMDVGMSIASAIFELKTANVKLSVKELFVSGLNIGKDMIGTMSNTLILAFAGSGLTTLLVLVSYGIKFNQFISSDYLAIEVARGLSSSMAIVLTVPLTSIISSIIYKRHTKK